ncbi:MAG: hypothetical protein AAF367_12745 [Pseudomonadota bacterium]
MSDPKDTKTDLPPLETEELRDMMRDVFTSGGTGIDRMIDRFFEEKDPR